MKPCRKCGSTDISPGNVKAQNWLCRGCKAIATKEHGMRYRSSPEVRAHRAKVKQEWANTDSGLESGRKSARRSGQKRRAAKLLRTPAWANHMWIDMICDEAHDIGMTVDHIIPLQGEFVSGLHVEYNLQYLTKSENCSKGNRI